MAREIYARFLRGKLDENRPLGRIRRRWVYSIKIGLKCIGWYGVDLDSSGSSRKYLDVEYVFGYNLDAVCETKLMNLLL